MIAVNIFEIEVHCVSSIVSSPAFSGLSFKPIYSIDLTSAQDDFAILRNRTNSRVDPLSWPSAILFEIERAARDIWSLKKYIFDSLYSSIIVLRSSSTIGWLA